MNKRRLHHYLTVLRGVKTWQLVVIALILSTVTLGLLRHNSITAVRMFQDVKQADQQNKNPYKELRKLQQYVSHHMNTQLERVALEKTYQRDYQAALEKAANSGNVNKVDYQTAQNICNQQFPGAYFEYARCVSDKVAQVAPGENPTIKENLPEPAEYQYTFVSPTWSPDAAGVSLLLTGVIWLFIVLKVTLQLLLKWLVRRRHRI